jgi:hypothetical protein
MSEEPASLILELLHQMRAELGNVRSEMATKTDISEVRADIATQFDLTALRANIAADILATRKERSEQITGLRQTVIDYHAMVLRVCPSLLRLHASAAAQQYDGFGPE